VSTQISVSVALEGLRKLSQAQINANRQSHLLQVQRQGQAQKAVDAQAQGQTGQGQASQGRNPRGQLLYGIKSDRQRPQPQSQPFAVYRRPAGFSSVVIYSDGAATRCTSDLVTLGPDDVNPWTPGSGVSDEWEAGPNMFGSGGPFNEPYFKWTSKVSGIGSPLLLGTGDFTLEGWFRWLPEYLVSVYPMLQVFSESAPGFAIYTYDDPPKYAALWEWSAEGGDLYSITRREFEGVTSWSHYAVSRQGNELRAWAGGQLISDLQFGPAPSQPVDYTSALVAALGSDIGQMRLTQGAARYWGDTITVPTAPFITL
jgi:hypothetical protein